MENPLHKNATPATHHMEKKIIKNLKGAAWFAHELGLEKK